MVVQPAAATARMENVTASLFIGVLLLMRAEETASNRRA
jgi:hypothetical protein